MTIQTDVAKLSYELSEEDVSALKLRAERRGYRIRKVQEINSQQLEALAILDADPRLCAEKYRALLDSTFLDRYVPKNGKKCGGCEGHNKWHSMDGCYMRRAKYASSK